MTDAVLGLGIGLKVGANPAAATATITLGGLTNIPAPPFSRGFVDVTAHDSPSGYREYIPDLKDPGEMSLDLNWHPGNTTHDEIVTMMSETEPRLFEIRYTQVTPNVTCTFRGLVTSFEPSGETTPQLTATIGLRVTGVPVWADVA